MNRRSALACSAFIWGALAMTTLFLLQRPTVSADSNAALAPYGMLDTEWTVTVQNLEGVVVVSGDKKTTVELEFGHKCVAGRAISSIGKDSQRVLVRTEMESRPGVISLSEEKVLPCPLDTLFWMGYQQYLLAAERYSQLEAERLASETQVEKDRRVVRRLLDERLTRK